MPKSSYTCFKHHLELYIILAFGCSSIHHLWMHGLHGLISNCAKGKSDFVRLRWQALQHLDHIRKTLRVRDFHYFLAIWALSFIAKLKKHAWAIKVVFGFILRKMYILFLIFLFVCCWNHSCKYNSRTWWLEPIALPTRKRARTGL